jgi:hypothetical protein
VSGLDSGRAVLLSLLNHRNGPFIFMFGNNWLVFGNNRDAWYSMEKSHAQQNPIHGQPIMRFGLFHAIFSLDTVVARTK